MVEEYCPIGGKIVTKPFVVLTILALLGIGLMAYRYIFGLGAVTNLSDGYPWGLWITYDVLVGTALGCGGYAVAILVYIFNRGEYHPMVRSAVLTSVFGYTLAAASIFLDIGRYWNSYHLFFPWFVNFNSVLVEVALCIAAYVLVLWLELAPALLANYPHSEKARIRRKRLEKLLPIIVSLGILLPTMHQSSLGAMMIIAGHKLSPLWQSHLLPLLFLISAISMGYAVVVFESILSSMAFGRPFEVRLMAKIGKVMAWLIGLFLLLRFGDLAVRGRLDLAFQGNLDGVMFLVEICCFMVSLIIMAGPSARGKLRWQFLGAVTMLLAGALYRFNSYLIGFHPGAGWHYFPALPEVMITIGIIAIELVAYLYFVKRFPVLPIAEQA